MWTHSKDGSKRQFWVRATRGRNRKKGGMGEMEGWKVNYLRLIPGLCLEDEMNWWESSRWWQLIWFHQMGPLPSNGIGRMEQHVREGKGRKKRWGWIGTSSLLEICRLIQTDKIINWRQTHNLCLLIIKSYTDKMTGFHFQWGIYSTITLYVNLKSFTYTITVLY